jgi:anthranilate phosphoribosyltransferase
MLHSALKQVMAGQSLGEDEADATMHVMMSGEAPPAQMAAMLTALSIKGETVDEIAGLARGMRSKALRVTLPVDLVAVDTCGTGGDGAGTFNISTAAAFVIAATGQSVAKHGNRAATSKCGSADVLEALGARVDLGPEDVALCIRETNFGFMFAPTYHPAMKYVIPVRKALGFRTVFNILGPLTNPAGVRTQVLGVADAKLVLPMAEALLRLGTRRALVVYGEDGLDEFSLSTYTQVAEVRGDTGDILEYRVHPRDLGLETATRDDIRGGDAASNAKLLRGILAGDVRGAPADIVCLNAGAALYAANRADSLAAGVTLARAQLRPDGALRTLGAFVALSQDLAVQAERQAVRSIAGK